MRPRLRGDLAEMMLDSTPSCARASSAQVRCSPQSTTSATLPLRPTVYSSVGLSTARQMLHTSTMIFMETCALLGVWP